MSESQRYPTRMTMSELSRQIFEMDRAALRYEFAAIFNVDIDDVPLPDDDETRRWREHRDKIRSALVRGEG